MLLLPLVAVAIADRIAVAVAALLPQSEQLLKCH